MTTITFVGWPTSGIVSPDTCIPMLRYAVSVCTLSSRTPRLSVVALRGCPRPHLIEWLPGKSTSAVGRCHPHSDQPTPSWVPGPTVHTYGHSDKSIVVHHKP
jgi:hypothetical protein